MYGTVTYSPPGREPLVSLPLSKSIAARSLVAAFVRGIKVDNALLPDCEDSRELHAALERLSDVALRDGDGRLIARSEAPERFDLGSGGTSFRFFLPLAASVEGLQAVVDCSPQLRRRPVSILVDALRRLGAEVEYAETEGCPPLLVRGRRLRGGDISVDGSVSSQFLSALMLAAPLWDEGVDIDITGNMVSAPYVEMTAGVMTRYGFKVACSKGKIFAAPADNICDSDRSVYYSEADWSAASYIYEYVWLTGRPVWIRQLEPPSASLQGDSACCTVFDNIGVDSVFDSSGGCVIRKRRSPVAGEKVVLRLNDTPDLVPALAVALAMGGTRFRLDDVAHLRFKESDRMIALKEGLEKLGVLIRCGDDFIDYDGGRCPFQAGAVIDTFSDHRMAMSFAVAAVCGAPVRISDPRCVEKSFSAFWREARSLGLEMTPEEGHD